MMQVPLAGTPANTPDVDTAPWIVSCCLALGQMGWQQPLTPKELLTGQALCLGSCVGASFEPSFCTYTCCFSHFLRVFSKFSSSLAACALRTNREGREQ